MKYSLNCFIFRKYQSFFRSIINKMRKKKVICVKLMDVVISRRKQIKKLLFQKIGQSEVGNMKPPFSVAVNR